MYSSRFSGKPPGSPAAAMVRVLCSPHRPFRTGRPAPAAAAAGPPTITYTFCPSPKYTRGSTARSPRGGSLFHDDDRLPLPWTASAVAATPPRGRACTPWCRPVALAGRGPPMPRTATTIMSCGSRPAPAAVAVHGQVGRELVVALDRTEPRYRSLGVGPEPFGVHAEQAGEGPPGDSWRSGRGRGDPRNTRQPPRHRWCSYRHWPPPLVSAWADLYPVQRGIERDAPDNGTARCRQQGLGRTAVVSQRPVGDWHR